MVSWTFDYDNELITVENSSMISDKFVDDGNSYTTFTTVTLNAPTDWTDDIQLYIVDDTSTDHAIGWNDTITLPSSTSWAKYKMTNTSGVQFTVDMFDERGRPLITKITVS